MLLQGKVLLVTGAASGIGRAIALLAAQEGASVLASDRDTAGEATVEAVRAGGGNAVFLAADVTRPEDGQRLVAGAVERFGRLDVAVNNAGIAGQGSATHELPDDAWQQVIDVNLSGVFYGMKPQLRQMLAQGGGAIVNLASILGQVGMAGTSAYTAAKHGVVGLTQAAALEYAARGIRINAVGPGFIQTPLIRRIEEDPARQAAIVAQHPIGRLGLPQEVAELVVWLASDRASFVTGAYYPVDGGYLAR